MKIKYLRINNNIKKNEYNKNNIFIYIYYYFYI